MQPSRLVLMPIDTCLICYGIDDDLNYQPTNYLTNMGFQYCNSCAEKVESHIIPARQLREMFKTECIKVKRSNGNIEDGWTLCGVAYTEGNEYKIDVTKDGLLKKVNLGETLRIQ
jgi:hypothetical protein